MQWDFPRNSYISNINFQFFSWSYICGTGLINVHFYFLWAITGSISTCYENCLFPCVLMHITIRFNLAKSGIEMVTKHILYISLAVFMASHKIMF